MADLQKAANRASAYSLLLSILWVTLFVRYTRAVTTSCVVQAFGTGLEGKGISVELKNVGCPSSASGRTVSNAAQFDGSGEAEVALQLDVDASGVCFEEMIVKITLPDDHGGCEGIPRTVSDISWASNVSGGVGSCRVLEQDCGQLFPTDEIFRVCARFGQMSNMCNIYRTSRKTSVAAIPYIDMWCSTPSGIGIDFEGQPQLLELSWSSDDRRDDC